MNTAMGAARPSDPSFRCRGCGSDGLLPVIDLGDQPPAERFLRPGEEAPPLPLALSVCQSCWLAQLPRPPTHSGDEPGGLAFTVSSTIRQHVEELVADVVDRVG